MAILASVGRGLGHSQHEVAFRDGIVLCPITTFGGVHDARAPRVESVVYSEVQPFCRQPVHAVLTEQQLCSFVFKRLFEVVWHFHGRERKVYEHVDEHRLLAVVMRVQLTLASLPRLTYGAWLRFSSCLLR